MADCNAMLFLSLPKYFLTLLGMWMLSYRNIPYKFYTSFIAAIQGSFLLFNFIHMVVVWGDVDQMSEGSYILFTHTSTCSKCLNFVFRKYAFSKLLDAMDERVFASQCEEHDKILTKHSNRVKMIYTVQMVTTFCTCILWCTIPLLDQTQKVLPFNVWMPVDTQTSPIYELGYVYQVLMIYYGSQIFLAIDAIFVALIFFICAQLEMIMVKTQKIREVPAGLSFDKNNEMMEQNNKLLIDCIKHHQAAIRFLEQVVNMFHAAFFLQMSNSILIVCVILFCISVEAPNSVHFYSTLIYFGLMLAQVFLICWSGNELTIRSEQLRDWIYVCPWYSNDIKFRRVLCIFMECLKRPVVVRAGLYIPLSRPTFVSILRCSYSYYAVLNQTQGTEE